MTTFSLFLSSFKTIALILVAMSGFALLEVLWPLHARIRENRDHLVPNLLLTFITFSTNLCFNIALVLTLVWLQTVGFGLLNWVHLPVWADVAIVVLGLDFTFYVAHRAMHRYPIFWRFHVIHHSDPVLDVTTTIRQHPGESVIRYAFMAVSACALGASPGSFAIYRAWSVLNGLSEHCNVRLPVWLDTALSLIITTPNTHKIHHSRQVRYTDSNYGNITIIFDRIFATFTPSRLGTNISYGLDGFDQQSMQTTRGLLRLPFRAQRARAAGSMDSAHATT